MIRDILHQEVKVGDMVVFNPPSYKGITTGKIVKLTPKGVTVEYDNKKQCNRSRNEIIKIDEQYKIACNLNPELFI